MKIKGILFDLIGTTVKEKDPSTINRCFENAFQDAGVVVDAPVIRRHRGMDKREAILSILDEVHAPASLAQAILNAFQQNLSKNIGQFAENDGLRETLAFFKRQNLTVGVGSGLPKQMASLIFRHLGWSNDMFDYVGVAESVGRGRPHPDMILDMLAKTGVSSNAFLKVGDTVADIIEGKNASVYTAAILAGTASENDIINARPDFVIRALPELRTIIARKQKS